MADTDQGTPNNQPTPQRSVSGNARAALALGALGLVVTVIGAITAPSIRVELPGEVVWRFALYLTLGALGGFVLRVLRRFVFFRGSASLHQAFSFDAIFQAGVALNPQLEYPGVESAFIQRHTGLHAEEVAPWFRVRATSALAIPLALLSLALLVSGQVTSSALAGLILAFWVGYSSYTSVPPGIRARFVAAVLLGIAAAAVEGLGFLYAGLILRPDVSPMQAVVLYLFLLTAYELSPIPFGLGVLEFAYTVFGALPGVDLPGLLIVLSYRLARAAMLPIAMVYLPRYKLAVRDIFSLSLPALLLQSMRPTGGWEDDDSSDRPLLSVIIPAYNEEERLPVYLPKVLEYCRGLQGKCEVLVVDDGSADGTRDYVRSVMPDWPDLKLLEQPTNMGKGAAVKRGALESKGRFVLFTDADGATPIDQTPKLLEPARQGIEVVIGSRTLGDEVNRSFLRALMGLAFYRLTNFLAVPNVSDTQCGFKLFRRVAADRIFPQVQESGWAFDVEVLFLAQKLGMAILEVPVHWTAIPGSKINPVKESIKMLVAILRIRKRHAGLTD